MTWRDWQRSVLTSALVVLTGLCASSGPVRAQAPATPPTLVLLTNQPAFGPGAGLSVTLGLQHAGAPLAADLYFGVILPDGVSVVYFEGLGLATRQGRLNDLTSIRPMLSGLGIGTGTNIVVPDFFRYTWQGNEPQGTYQFFFAATRPGALGDGRVDGGDLLAMKTQSILNLPPATITTDAGHAGSAEVGPGGGTVVATAADGTVYTLTVPRGALATATTITLMPVTSLTGWPAPVELAAGVQGAPSGLRFARPAALVVELPQPLVGDVFGMPMPNSGSGFDLVPVERSGHRLRMTVEHFSILAIPRTLPALAALIAPTSHYARAIELSGAAGSADTAAAVQELLDFLATWYDTVVDPLFVDAVTGSQSDEARLAALAEFKRWEDRRVVFDMAFGMFELAGAPARGRLVGRATQGRQAALTLLSDAYQQWNSQCQASTAPTVDRLRLADRAAGFVILGDVYLADLDQTQADPDVVQAPPLDLQAAGFTYPQILASLCAREVVHEVLEPDVSPGGTGSLRVTAGVTLAGQPPAFGSFMRVYFHADPTSPTVTAEAATDDGGVASFQVTADANGTIRYRVCTFFRDEQFPSGLAILRILVDGPEACRQSVTGVVVTPSQVNIAPSASQQFTAVVEGTSNQAVTWSVDGGGTITQAGLFTSNGTQGTFFVRATSAEDPNSVGVAQVTVGTPPPPPPGELPCIDDACTFSGSWIRCETRNDGTVACVDVTALFLNPQARVFPQIGQPARLGVSVTCARTGSFSTLVGPIQPTGAFTVSQLSGSNICVLGTATGTLSASSLQFTLVDGFDSRRVFTFSGTR